MTSYQQIDLNRIPELFTIISRKSWIDYSWKLRNLIILNDSSHINKNAISWVLHSIDVISSNVEYYHGLKSSILLNKILTGIMYILTDTQYLVLNQKVGNLVDTDEYRYLKDLCALFHSESICQFNADKIIHLIDDIYQLWVNMILAISVKDWDLDIMYIDDINIKFTQISDLLSDDIIHTCPKMFN